MSERPGNAAQQPDYLSYLLRLWRMEGSADAWRGSVESPQTGERLGFGSLDELFAFLREQTVCLVMIEVNNAAGIQEQHGRETLRTAIRFVARAIRARLRKLWSKAACMPCSVTEPFSEIASRRIGMITSSKISGRPVRQSSQGRKSYTGRHEAPDSFSLMSWSSFNRVRAR